MVLLISDTYAFAQLNHQGRTVNLVGTVADSFTLMGVEASVWLLNADSVLLDSGSTMMFDHTAYFSFRVPAVRSTYLLKVKSEGYETLYASCKLKRVGRNTRMDIPTIFVKRDAIALDDVAVTATRVKVVHRGDTVVFNAAAFNVAEGSMLDNLIAQLPGAEIKPTGEIFMNGKKIDYLLLNGRDFYHGNNRLLMENLPYYMVQNVKVYHHETDRARFAGLRNEKKDYVMDVNLKRQYRHGYVANAEAGGGSSDSYLTRLFGLRFTDHSRLSIIGNANNLNSEYKPSENNGWDETTVHGREERTSRKSMNGELSIDAEKWKNDVEAAVAWRRDIGAQREYAETLTADSALFSETFSQKATRSLTTSLTNTFTLKVPFYLLSSSSFSYTDNNGMQNLNYRSGRTSQSQRNCSSGHAVAFGQELASTHKMAWGDVLDLNARFGYSEKPVHSTEEMVTESETLSERQQKASHRSRETEMAAGAAYAIPDMHDGQYRMKLFYGRSRINDGESRYNLTESRQDTENSYRLRQTRHSFVGTLSYQREHWTDNDYLSLHIRLPFRFAYIRSYYAKSALDTCLTQREWFVEPSLQVERGWNGHNLKISAEHVRTLPDLTQLLNPGTSVNPLHTYVGNHHLKSEGHTYLSASYMQTRSSGQQILSLLKWTYYHNQIVQSYTYNASNSHFTHQPQNVSGSWTGTAYLRLSYRLGAKSHLWCGTESEVKISRTKDFSGVEGKQPAKLNTISCLDGRETVNIVYDKSSTRIEIRGSVEWFRTAAEANCIETVNALHFRYGANVTTRLPLNMSLTSSLFVEHRRGYTTSSLNSNECQWNMTLGRSFLKGKRLHISLSAEDILHDHSSVTYRVSASGRAEVWQYSLPSYWLLRIGYRFNLNPKSLR